MSILYDAAIVGAGPAGSATAHYLAKQGLKVVLLDKFSFPRDKTCGDALSPRALRVLDEMELLDSVLQVGHRLSTVEFIAPNGHSAIAPIPRQAKRSDTLLFVPRLILDNILLERARASGADFQERIRVTAITRDGTAMVVKGEQQQQRQSVSFRARIVVIATGTNAKLLLQTGILTKPPQMMLCTRTYYEDIQNMPQHAQCRFDGIPQPGYGWLFPLSTSRVNIGLGLFKTGLSSLWMPRTAQAAFNTFLKTRPLQEMLRGAHQVGPLKGYPLRVDFARSPTFGDGVFVVGEAAGLVNPVTGEGIDYALESGKIVAEHLLHMFAIDTSPAIQQKLYDQHLRQQYQHLFVMCDRLRLFYLNPLVLNQVIRAASNNDDLMALFMNVAIENLDVYKGLSAKTISKVFLRKHAIPGNG